MSPLRFGKHPPRVDYRTLLFKDYLTPLLPPPPASYDVLPVVYNNLNINDPAQLFPIDSNDSLSDCTIAAVAHAITVYNGLISKNNIWDNQDVVKLYYQLTKGVDSGLVELDVLNYWQSNLINGDQILAFTSIQLSNHQNIKQAIKLFGGVYVGFRVQQNCIQDFDNKQPWTPGPLTNDGHAVFATGYDENGVTVLTWGSTQQGTWDWWDACVDEAYAILPPEANNPGYAPGYDIAQLKADLDAVAG
jgi:hypothetical protein